MTTKHTPGPWRVNPCTGEVRGADWNHIVAEAAIDSDAHLIAAAPDLLAACEMALLDMRYYATVHGESVTAIEAAIAKAKGETK